MHLTTGDISLLLLASLFIGYGIYKIYSLITSTINSLKNEYSLLKHKLDNTERTIQQLSNEATTMMRINQMHASFNLGTDIGRALQPIVAMFRRSLNPPRPSIDTDSMVSPRPPSPIIPRPRTRREPAIYNPELETLNLRVPQQPPEIVQRRNIPVEDCTERISEHDNQE